MAGSVGFKSAGDEYPTVLQLRRRMEKPGLRHGSGKFKTVQSVGGSEGVGGIPPQAQKLMERNSMVTDLAGMVCSPAYSDTCNRSIFFQQPLVALPAGASLFTRSRGTTRGMKQPDRYARP